MEEQPLSAAIVVADVYAPGFDGSCHNSSNIFGPPPCDVVTFATGLRNAYDFTFHSNGLMYAPDNGLGVTGSYPPSPTAPCLGMANPAPYTQGGHNPGTQPDLLVVVEEGKYYGHPNPHRDECVFKDGSYQGVSPLPNYQPPIFTLGNNSSSNGTIEYQSGVFCSQLQGQLLIANYSVGDDIMHIKLSADGRSVVSSGVLANGFNDPLPLAQGPDGTIYVGEFGGDLVTALAPIDSGCWAEAAPLPASRLDAGGAALDGKLYVVAGKVLAGPVSTTFAYDPALNTWSTRANLPGPAVENPAVVGLNGKLYAFGGSTAPFSGAVTNAAAYNPATNAWTVLAPLPTARGGAAAAAINGLIYVAGGMTGSGASVDTLEVYNPATNTWSAAAALPTRRDNPGAAAVDGKLYVFGGRTREANGTEINGTLQVVEMYDPATNTWSPRAPMPTGRRTMGVGTLGGRVQLMGGERTPDGLTFEENEQYDAATDTWTALAPMPAPRHGMACGTINGVVYTAGGGTVAGSSFSTIVEGFSLSQP
jgi:N-acetylneuraminic acid mutarotase